MLFSNESNFILFIPRSMLSASGTTVLFFKIATNLCQNALVLLMPVFILRVPLIFSVFAFWIWLGISLSCPLPFRILTPKHWGPLAYLILDAPNFYNFDAIVIDERWPDDSCPDDLILTKRKLRWPTNRNFVMPFARVHSSSAVLLFFKNLFKQSKARIKKILQCDWLLVRGKAVLKIAYTRGAPGTRERHISKPIARDVDF